MIVNVHHVQIYDWFEKIKVYVLVRDKEKINILFVLGWHCSRLANFPSIRV